jgi:hypothetical protein
MIPEPDDWDALEHMLASCTLSQVLRFAAAVQEIESQREELYLELGTASTVPPKDPEVR